MGKVVPQEYPEGRPRDGQVLSYELRHGTYHLAARGGIVARRSVGSSITEIVFCATVQAIVAVPPEQTVVTGLAE